MPEQERKRTVVVGLGNSLMTDEGVGIYIVRELMSSSAQGSDVDFVEAGTSLMAVVHAIAGRRRALVVDCAWMDEAPGTIRCFRPDTVVSRKGLKHLSLHEGDLLDGLELSRKLGEYPEEVLIYGIQPQSVQPGQSLSSALSERMGSYVEAIAAGLNGQSSRFEERARESA